MRCLSVFLLALSCAVGSSHLALGQVSREKEGISPSETTSSGSVREQTIYIPYSKLRDIFEKEGRGVFLPYDKFQELWGKARQADTPEPEPKPPVDSLLSAIENEAVVTQDVVRVTATAKIEVLRAGWHEVPLRLSDAAMLDASLNGEGARVVYREGGHYLSIEKTGSQPADCQLRLTYAKAYTKSPGRNSVSFETPQAPVNRQQIRVPEPGG